MKVEEFKQRIEAWRERVAVLQQSTNELHISPQEPIKETFFKLQTALAELEVAKEELRQQNEQLQQHNQELVAAQAAADAERQRYQDLFEFAPDGYLVIDIDGKIEEANQAVATLLNVRQKYLIGKPLVVFVDQPQRHSFHSQLNWLYQKDGVKDWEVRFCPRYGKPIETALTIAVVRNSKGIPVALRICIRDITKHKQAAAERDRLFKQLAAERTQLEAVVQQMPVGVAIAEAPSGKLVLHNEEAAQILRHPLLPADQVNDYAQYGAFHADGQPYKLEDYPIARSIISGEVVKAEDMNYRRGDGNETFFSVNAAPIINRSGHIVAAVSTFYDISERKRAELKLRTSEERLRLALEAVQMSTWDWNILTNQVTLSDEYNQLFGLNSGNFEGTCITFLSCVYPEDRKLVVQAITRSIKKRIGYDQEFRIVKPDRSIRWLEAKGQVFYNQAGQAVRMMGVIMDITEHKRTAEQIKVSQQENAELLRLNQLKDDFLSTVSHELRTPMSNMKMAIQMLKISPTAERSHCYLEILQTECNREIELINDLLDLQRLETASYSNLHIKAINLQELLSNIIEPFQVRTQQRQQTLHSSLSNDLPALISDRASCERILAELLNNACKYTPDGGEIVLSCYYKSVEATTIFTISNPAEIPVDQLPRIFDKFYRVTNTNPWKQGGTGLGLALVKNLVEQLQGKIQVESSKGLTTFTVELPNIKSV